MIQTFYVDAPRVSRRGRKRSERLIGPDVQHIVAWRYEKGEHPDDIAAGMNLTKAAVRDIIAVYERRAKLFFKITRTGK